MCAEDAVCKPQQAAASLWYCGLNQARCGKAANIGCPDDTIVLQDVSTSNASQPGSSAFLSLLVACPQPPCCRPWAVLQAGRHRLQHAWTDGTQRRWPAWAGGLRARIPRHRKPSPKP